MADTYSRAKFIDDLVGSGLFTYEEAKKHADEHERGAPTKVEKPDSAVISEPSPAEVQAGLKDMTAAREQQEGLTFGQKVGIGAGVGGAVAAGSYLLGKKSGIKDRTIGEGTRIEPQMDVNQQGPREPTLLLKNPPQPKRLLLPNNSMLNMAFHCLKLKSTIKCQSKTCKKPVCLVGHTSPTLHQPQRLV